MKKISVIVPVYNMEKYLEKCLDSLVNQTLKEIEIIVINDGSTDNSYKILDKYKKKYSDILTVINTENNGISIARNIGIKEATGEYIAFIDSDDYVDINMFSDCYLYAKKNNLDIVVLDYYKLYENNGKLEYFKIKDFDNTNIKNNPKLLFEINSSPWNKIYKRSLFDKTTIFPEKTKYEDLGLIPILLDKANNIGYLNKAYNYYLIRGKSETTTIDKRVYDIFKILDILNNYFKNKYKNELEYLNIEKIMTYTISSRGIKDNRVRNEFIDSAFKYLNNNFHNWKKNKYYTNRNKIKRFIEKNKIITKLYCYLYALKNK